MAIAVPFLVTAAGGTAMAAAITAVAFQVTGISDKINKAAANVFGEDLVKVANIAGTAFAMYNGGFGFDTASEAAADGINGLDSTSALVDTPNAAALSDAGGQTIADTMTTPYDPTPASMDGLPVSTDVTATAAAAPSTNGSSLADIQKLAQVDPAQVQVEPPKFELGGAAADQSAGASMSSADRAALNSNIGYAGNNVTDTGPGFFDKLQKLVIDPRTGNVTNGALQMGGNILQGAFGGYSAAKAREQQQAQYEAALARQARLANLGTAGWKQTQ